MKLPPVPNECDRSPQAGPAYFDYSDMDAYGLLCYNAAIAQPLDDIPPRLFGLENTAALLAAGMACINRHLLQGEFADAVKVTEMSADLWKTFQARAGKPPPLDESQSWKESAYALRDQLSVALEELAALRADLRDLLLEAESANTENDQELIVLQDFYWAVHAIVYANLKETK